MTMRWFGPGHDPIPLENLRQVPGIEGVITSMHGVPAGEPWTREGFAGLKSAVESAGLTVEGIESVNVHDSIKAGTADRDRRIEAYIATLGVLGEAGIRMVCYNFMPVFDWTRSDLARPRPDGSTVLAYDRRVVDSIDPTEMFGRMEAGSRGTVMPGWEPERLSRIGELFALYEGIDGEALFANLVYFLKAVMPTCERHGIRMAIHPDDPAWPIFGLPRIATGMETLLRIVRAVDSPCNGVAVCSGSLGSAPENDVPAIIRALGDRVFFAHVRNVRHVAPGDFEEAAHLSRDGSLDIYEVVRALEEIGFDGPVRPDHGRNVWGETACVPGYGLYDRAMGLCYLNGLLEAIRKSRHGKEGRRER